MAAEVDLSTWTTSDNRATAEALVVMGGWGFGFCHGSQLPYVAVILHEMHDMEQMLGSPPFSSGNCQNPTNIDSLVSLRNTGTYDVKTISTQE